MTVDYNIYNEMLPNLLTGLFKTTLESSCQRLAVQLIQVNPAFTTIMGLIKYMDIAKYGLNSSTAALVTGLSRDLKLSEKIPQCLLRPGNFNKHNRSNWRLVSSFMKLNPIRRTQLFQWMKALEGIRAP